MEKDLPAPAPPGWRPAVNPPLRALRLGLFLLLLLTAATLVDPPQPLAATGPVVTIDSGPGPNPTNDPTPTFTFSSPDPLATSQCRLDADSFAPCTSPFTTSPLADGAHTFDVVATDVLGNPGPTASRSFGVDTAPPDARITAGPTGPTRDSTPTFGFDAEPGASFQCKLDGASYAACTSPWTAAPLPDGAQTFTVEAFDAAGNQDPSPASASFVVDTTPPQTVIVSGPPSSSDDSTPAFVFAATEGGASFECSLDHGAFSPCASPRLLGPLRAGGHSFVVRARDAAGNLDPSPAALAFTVVAPAVDRPSPIALVDPAPVLATAFAGDLTKAVETLRRSELTAIAKRRGITIRGIKPLLPGTARMRAGARSRRSARRVTVLRGASTFAVARRGRIRLRPTTAGRRLLSRARRLRLLLDYVFSTRIGVRMSAAQGVTVWRRWLTLAEVARVARRAIRRYFGDRPTSLTLDRCTRRGPTRIWCGNVRWLHRARWWHVRLRVRETETGFRQQMSDAYS